MKEKKSRNKKGGEENHKCLANFTFSIVQEGKKEE